MTTVVDWLELVKAHYGEADWLEENEDELYHTVVEYLKSPDMLPQAIDILLMTFPHLIFYEDVKRWAKLVREASKIAASHYVPNPDKGTSFNSIYMIVPQGAKSPAPKTKRRPRERIDSRKLFEAYLILLTTQFYDQAPQMSLERIDDLLRLARNVNDAYTYAKTYQTLAFIYNSQGDYARAFDRAQIAFNYWAGKDLNDPDMRIDAALSAFAASGAYVGMQDWEFADEWLEKAADLAVGTDYRLQYGTIAAQRGAVYILMKEYQAAVQWNVIAMQEFAVLKAQFHTALAHHHMGMAQAYLRQFDEAQQNLDTSMQMWQDLGNIPQMLDAEHTLAYLEASRGNRKEALKRLNSMLQRLEPLQNNKWKEYRQDMAKRLIRGIENNEDLDNLKLDN